MLHTNPGTLIFSGCQIICDFLPCLLGQLSYSTRTQGQSLRWQGLLPPYPSTEPATHKTIMSFPLSLTQALQCRTLSHILAAPLCLGPSTLTHRRKQKGLLAAGNTPTPSPSLQSQAEPWIFSVWAGQDSTDGGSLPQHPGSSPLRCGHRRPGKAPGAKCHLPPHTAHGYYPINCPLMPDRRRPAAMLQPACCPGHPHSRADCRARGQQG